MFVVYTKQCDHLSFFQQSDFCARGCLCMRVHVRVLERMCTVFLTPVNVLVPAAGAGDAAATAGMGSALDRVAGASKFLKRNMSAKKNTST